MNKLEFRCHYVVMVMPGQHVTLCFLHIPAKRICTEQRYVSL